MTEKGYELPIPAAGENVRSSQEQTFNVLPGYDWVSPLPAIRNVLKMRLGIANMYHCREAQLQHHAPKPMVSGASAPPIFVVKFGLL